MGRGREWELPERNDSRNHSRKYSQELWEVTSLVSTYRSHVQNEKFWKIPLFTSDVIKVQGEDPATPGCLKETGWGFTPAILNRGCVTSWLALMKPQYRTLIPQYDDAGPQEHKTRRDSQPEPAPFHFLGPPKVEWAEVPCKNFETAHLP